MIRLVLAAILMSLVATGYACADTKDVYTIRNISVTGAMIEGLWNVPVGTPFQLQISHNHTLACVMRWSAEDRMGVEFANPLQRDSSGQITAIQAAPPIEVTFEQLQQAS